MAPKVTLSIPDELAKEIEPLRDEINMSHIFQQAMWAEVRRRSAASSALGDMTGLIAHLRSEKSEGEDISYQAGFEEARRQIGNDTDGYISYAELRDWVRRAKEAHSSGDYQVLMPEGDFENAFYEEAVPDLIDEGVLGEEEVEHERYDDWPSETFENYARGWHDGVLAVWNQIKDSL